MVANTTVVNAGTMCELLWAVAGQGLAGPVTMVLDNARHQRNAMVVPLAAERKIELLFLPSRLSNLNLLERPWRFTKRRACYGKFHADFAGFRSAVESVPGAPTTTHAEEMASLMTLNFQEVNDASLTGR